jgi:hypothetical protein
MAPALKAGRLRAVADPDLVPLKTDVPDALVAH